MTATAPATPAQAHTRPFSAAVSAATSTIATLRAWRSTARPSRIARVSGCVGPRTDEGSMIMSSVRHPRP